jgi:outer membrane autotransporter protein
MRSITNSGTIISETNTAILIGANGAVTDGITNSGIIRGGSLDGTGKAIDASASSANLTINNSGTIVGKILFGTGTDTLNITGGRITGDVSGDSKDTVNFTLGSGSFTTGGTFAGFGDVNIKSGTVKLAHAIQATRVTNAGTVDVGATTQTITGSYTQTSTGTLKTTLTNTTSGKLVVTGNASVAGTIFADGSGRDAPITPGTEFTVLQAGNLTSSTATLATNTLANFKLQNVNNSIKLVLQSGLNPDNPRVKVIQNTPAAKGLTTVLERFSTSAVKFNSELDKVLRRLTGESVDGKTLTTDESEQASIHLTPNTSMSGGNSAALNNVSRAFSSNITTRLAGVRSTDQQTGLAGGDQVLRGIELWTQPFISSISQDKSDGIDAKSRGVSIGADTLVMDNFRVGIAVGYSDSDVDGTGSRSGDTSDISGYQATLYGAYTRGPWYADLQLGYSLSQTEALRNTGITNNNLIAEGEYDTQQYAARLAGGYNYTFNGLELTPNLFFQITKSKQDGYTEKSAGSAGLTVDSVDTVSKQAGIGLRLAYPVAIQAGRLVPELRLGYTREFDTDRHLDLPRRRRRVRLAGRQPGRKPVQYRFGPDLLLHRQLDAIG